MMVDWDSEDIKAAIRKTGESLASLGARHGIMRQVMANALVIPHAQAERVIADYLKVPPHEIWPSRYEADGRRRKPQPAANYRPHRRFRKSADAA